jgi:Xaa-Pro aminopeptidase
LRGSDINYNPVFFSYVVISVDQVHLFIDEAKVVPAVYNHFSDEGLQVTIHPYEKINSFLKDEVR